MKIAVLGDIHGNHLALEAVLKSAKDMGVESLMITGDIVGYYPFVNEVVELLDSWDSQIVMGNHELMMLEAMKDEAYLRKITKQYGSSIEVAIKTLSKNQIDKLINLPFTIHLDINSSSIILCHGSPVDVNEYIYPDANLSKLKWLQDISAEIIICGHTHYPMKLKYKDKMIINPGSVGQSRNGVAKAHWAIFDTEKNKFKFMLEDYNIQTIIDKVKITDPHNIYLQRVLTR